MPISTINSNSIKDGTVIAADILDGTISTSKLVASNIAGDRIAANTLSNTVFQTGSVENYLNAQSGGALSGRNRVINGAMMIDQRNSGAAVTPADSAYTLDRWQVQASQSSKFTVQQDSSANTVAGFSSSLKVTSLSSYSITSGDYFLVTQKIEGNNLKDIQWGTASAAPVTLSFWTRSSLTGTFGVILTNSAENRFYPASYTITSADTWEKKTITIAGDTSGTWLANNSTGIRISFGLGVGSTYSFTAGSWTSSSSYGTSGATSVVGTNGATWYVTGVQLEKGSIATPFEYRHYGTELQLCQRYYQFAGNGTSSTVIYGYPASGGSSFRVLQVNMPVAMRTAPTVTYTAGGAGSFSTFYSDTNFFNALSNAGNTTTDNNIYGYKASAEL